jgi:hypothetical protein
MTKMIRARVTNEVTAVVGQYSVLEPYDYEDVTLECPYCHEPMVRILSAQPSRTVQNNEGGNIVLAEVIPDEYAVVGCEQCGDGDELVMFTVPVEKLHFGRSESSS